MTTARVPGGPRPSPLPDPPAWSGDRPRVWSAAAASFLALLSLGAAVGAASAFLSGHPVAGLLVALVAAYPAHVVGMVLRTWYRPWRTSRTGTHIVDVDGVKGVRFGYSAWAYYWVVAVVLLSMAGLVVVTAL